MNLLTTRGLLLQIPPSELDDEATPENDSLIKDEPLASEIALLKTVVVDKSQSCSLGTTKFCTAAWAA
jgi:hypothetical protein